MGLLRPPLPSRRSHARALTRFTTTDAHAALPSSCVRLLRKAPELVDTFLPHIVVLLTDRNHNVLLAGVTLVGAVVEAAPAYGEK